MEANPILASAAAAPPSVASAAAAPDGDFRARQEREVEKNFQAFQARRDELLRAHGGKYALMRDGEVIECYAKLADALKTGKLLYRGDVFSVQRIHARPVDVGLRRPPVLRAPSPKFSVSEPMTAAGGGK